MIKWLAYIIFSLILIPCISAAKTYPCGNNPIHYLSTMYSDSSSLAVADTTIKPKPQKPSETDDKKKIKEVTRAKPVPKPVKIEAEDPDKKKPKRQRRPPGMERPPEIPRRNGN